MIMLFGIAIGEKVIDGQMICASFISIFMGFVLKMTKDWNSGPISSKKIVVQLLFSMGIGYFCFIYSFNRDWDGTYKQIFFGFMSFISAEAVTAIESMAEDGIKRYIAEKINSLIGKKSDK